MDTTFSFTFFLGMIMSFLRDAVYHTFKFLEKMIFMSYTISSANNQIYVDEICDHIENNMVFWQTRTYDLYPDSAQNKPLPGQKCVLGDGLYFFWYRYTFMWVYIKNYLDNSTRPTIYWSGCSTERRLSIMTLRWNFWNFNEFFKEMYTRSNDHPASIFYLSTQMGASWTKLGPLYERHLSSVILPSKTTQMVVNDIQDFFKDETKQFYQERGLHYKRGIMLHGLPGCGKTSLVNALANEFNLNVYIFSLTGGYMNDEYFMKAILGIPPKSIVLFEDIDVAFPDPRKLSAEEKKLRDEAEELASRGINMLRSGPKSICQVSMKAFLNGIDGIRSNNNGVIFMFTTNHPENLDPALLRAGRMDLKVELKTLEHDEIRRMFLMFFPNEEKWSIKFADYLDNKGIIPAEFNEFLIAHLYQSLEITWSEKTKLLEKKFDEKVSKENRTNVKTNQTETKRRKSLSDLRASQTIKKISPLKNIDQSKCPSICLMKAF